MVIHHDRAAGINQAEADSRAGQTRPGHGFIQQRLNAGCFGMVLFFYAFCLPQQQTKSADQQHDDHVLDHRISLRR